MTQTVGLLHHTFTRFAYALCCVVRSRKVTLYIHIYLLCFTIDALHFSSLPLSSKRSQQRTFRLKHRVRLSELWLMEVVEPLLVAPLSPELCLVFGWPIANNLVVQFSSVEEKELWSGLLEKWVPFSFVWFNYRFRKPVLRFTYT